MAILLTILLAWLVLSVPGSLMVSYLLAVKLPRRRPQPARQS